MSAKEAEKMYNAYFQTVYRICFLYMKNEADACDMVQETFLRLLKNQPEFEDEEKARAWLVITASNCCKTQLTRWWHKKRSAYDEGQIQNLSYQTFENMLELVLGMERKYSVPTYLYYYEGYKTGEIADILGINPSTVQTRLSKARKLLKLEIENERTV